MEWNGTTNDEAAYYNILSTELRYIWLSITDAILLFKNVIQYNLRLESRNVLHLEH